MYADTLTVYIDILVFGTLLFQNLPWKLRCTMHGFDVFNEYWRVRTREYILYQNTREYTYKWEAVLSTEYSATILIILCFINRQSTSIMAMSLAKDRWHKKNWMCKTQRAYRIERACPTTWCYALFQLNNKWNCLPKVPFVCDNCLSVQARFSISALLNTISIAAQSI